MSQTTNGIDRPCDELSTISEELRRKARNPGRANESMIGAVLGEHLEAVVRSHNTPSVLFHFSVYEQLFVLKVEFGLAQTLRREVRWYREALSMGFPCKLLVDSHTGKSLSFLILHRFGDTSTVDDAALSGESDSTLRYHITRALDRDNDLFGRTSHTVDFSHAHSFTVDRFQRRCAQAMKYPYLRPLLVSDAIRINGERLCSPIRCWNQISSMRSAFQYLTSQKIGMTYGDLHCGNILINGLATELVDPRGGPLLPITYDYGKIIQSVEGGYGAIMASQYALHRVADMQYEFSVETPIGFQKLESFSKDYYGDRQYLQSLYQAALHFTAMLAHHASVPSETAALFMSGTLLFNKLIAFLRS